MIKTVTCINNPHAWCYFVAHRCGEGGGIIQWNAPSETTTIQHVTMVKQSFSGSPFYHSDFHMVYEGQWELVAMVFHGSCKNCGQEYQAWSYKFAEDGRHIRDAVWISTTGE